MNPPINALPYIPGKGHGTLPLVDRQSNSNLLTVFMDVQHDFLCDRLYAAAARVSAYEEGKPVGARNMVRLTDGPPDAPGKEREMLASFLPALLRALSEKAVLDEYEHLRAPIHLVFWNPFVLDSLLAGLARHFDALLSQAPAVYDLLTQKAAFSSPMITFLDRELHRKNLPLVCPSLQSVASYLGFNWGSHEDGAGDVSLPYREAFRGRLFDGMGRLKAEGDEEDGAFYTARARFNSQIPLEYAYAAWGELPTPEGKADPYRVYRGVTPDLLIGLMKRRLKALAHVTDSFYTEHFRGNPRIQKLPFNLQGLDEFEDQADTLADALHEFSLIERHVQLADWKARRQATPEERLLRGDTLLAVYHEDDQPASQEVEEDEEDDGRLAAGHLLRLRLWEAGTDTDLSRALALSGVKVGDRLLLSPRWITNTWRQNERQNAANDEPQTPTPEQMLYSTRVEVVGIEGVQNIKAPLFVTAEVKASFGNDGIFQFPAAGKLTLTDGAAYTLDSDPNNPFGLWQAQIARRLGFLEHTGTSQDAEREDYEPDPDADEYHALYERLTQGSLPEKPAADVCWPSAAVAGQTLFLAGLDALRLAGVWPDELEESKRQLIGEHGGDPLLLVQGPPGTGKSTTTAYAVLARLHGAILAGLQLRVFLSCKTHAATDVLLGKVLDVQERLAAVHDRYPDLFLRHLDPRLLHVPLFRLAPRKPPLLGIGTLEKEHNPRRRGVPSNWDCLAAQEQCVVAGTPGGIYGLVKGRWKTDLFEHKLCDLLVLDEASQMSLPEAMLAGLPLRRSGRTIVVGDPRQMPPVVMHDWASEPRRTFQRFRAFESLYHYLLPLGVPEIKFERSFRVHKEVAEYLRREVYARDGIAYYSTNKDRLPEVRHDDPFVSAVLDPSHPIIVIVHDEDASQTCNAYEQALLAPILSALTDPFRYTLDAETGLGVVVPHRAQRAALQQQFPGLASAIDTVERYQGDEREVILISATESDPDYLAEAGEFLLNPNRMVVALSRAKKKLILVASRSVFSHRSLDEDLFRASCLWKNLLRKTCTDRLWQGEQDGHNVTVWGKAQEEA